MKVSGFIVVNIARPSNDQIQPSVHLSTVFKNFGDAYKEMERLWTAEKKAFDETNEPYTSLWDGNTMRGLKYVSQVGGIVLDMWIIKEVSVEVEE